MLNLHIEWNDLRQICLPKCCWWSFHKVPLSSLSDGLDDSDAASYRDVADAQNIHLCTWRFQGIYYQDQVFLGLQNAAICIHLH